jgi:hypothetical protein
LEGGGSGSGSENAEEWVEKSPLPADAAGEQHRDRSEVKKEKPNKKNNFFIKIKLINLPKKQNKKTKLNDFPKK